MSSDRLTEVEWSSLGVTFKVVDEELTEAVLEHLRTSFLPDEPLCRSAVALSFMKDYCTSFNGIVE